MIWAIFETGFILGASAGILLLGVVKGLAGRGADPRNQCRWGLRQSMRRRDQEFSHNFQVRRLLIQADERP